MCADIRGLAPIVRTGPRPTTRPLAQIASDLIEAQRKYADRRVPGDGNLKYQHRWDVLSGMVKVSVMAKVEIKNHSLAYQLRSEGKR